jgi:hypothetical protein
VTGSFFVAGCHNANGFFDESSRKFGLGRKEPKIPHFHKAENLEKSVDVSWFRKPDEKHVAILINFLTSATMEPVYSDAFSLDQVGTPVVRNGEIPSSTNRHRLLVPMEQSR